MNKSTIVVSSIMIFGFVLSFLIISYGVNQIMNIQNKEDGRLNKSIEYKLTSELDKRLAQLSFTSSIIASEHEAGNAHPLLLSELHEYMKSIRNTYNMSGFTYALNLQAKNNNERSESLDYLDMVGGFYDKNYGLIDLENKIKKGIGVYSSVYSFSYDSNNRNNDIGKTVDFKKYLDYKDTHGWISKKDDMDIINIYMPVSTSSGKFIGGVIARWNIRDILMSVIDYVKKHNKEGVIYEMKYNNDGYYFLYHSPIYTGLLNEKKSNIINYHGISLNIKAKINHNSIASVLFNDGYILTSILIFLIAVLISFLAKIDINFKVNLKYQIHEKTRDLEKINQRNMMLFNSIPFGIGVVSCGRWHRVNDKLPEILGFEDIDEMMGVSVIDTFSSEAYNRESFKLKELEKSSDKSYFYEGRIDINNLNTPVEVASSSFIDDEAIYLFRDITDISMKRKELLILEAAINQTSQSVLIINKEGVVMFENKAAISLFSKEQCGHIEHTVDDDASTKIEVLNSVINQIHYTTSISLNNSDKRYISREMSPMVIDGNRLSIIIDTNITESVNERNIQEHSQRLESIGILAGGVAHDFNNLLTVVLGNSSLIKRDGLNEKDERRLNNIEDASRKAAKLCKQMLSYSGKGSLVMDDININNLIEDTAELLASSISKMISIDTDLTNSSLCNVYGDESQMQQVVMNIIINASEAMSDAGNISISSNIIDIKNNKHPDNIDFILNLNQKIIDGKYIHIKFTDNGKGMSEDVLNKIFDPFFTTKETGNGLGMSAVIGILRSHNGYVSIRSEIDVGSVFDIILPASKLKESSGSNVIIESKGKRNGLKKILVVDDEESIREFVALVLNESGYETIEAADGLEALEKYHSNKDSIGCIILDVTMPKMNGIDVAKEIRKHDIETKIILSSGYSFDYINNESGKSGMPMINGIIEKPYDAVSVVKYIENIDVES